MRVTNLFDVTFWFCGDEETGVGLQCRDCDRGGAPIAYYPGMGCGEHSYQGTDVEIVRTPTALISAGRRHMLDHRRAILDGKVKP